MSLESDISQCKKELVDRAKKSGIYENFGQDEVRKLEDKYINLSDYSERMQLNRFYLRQFNEWGMDFDLSQVREVTEW